MKPLLLKLVALLSLAVTPVLAGETAQATFVVHCYDVGVSALRGRPGVLSVKPGWLGFREVDRVNYDPQIVDRAQLESWLQDAGTYIETIDEEPRQP